MGRRWSRRCANSLGDPAEGNELRCGDSLVAVEGRQRSSHELLTRQLTSWHVHGRLKLQGELKRRPVRTTTTKKDAAVGSSLEARKAAKPMRCRAGQDKLAVRLMLAELMMLHIEAMQQ